jgi:hypothetical protein
MGTLDSELEKHSVGRLPEDRGTAIASSASDTNWNARLPNVLVACGASQAPI